MTISLLVNDLPRRLYLLPNLKSQEIDLLNAVESDEECDLGNKSSEEDRIIRASFLRWLCISETTANTINIKGIQLRKAVIEGILDISDVEIKFPLRLHDCTFREEIRLNHARLRDVSLTGSTLVTLQAEGARIEGDLKLDKIQKSSGIELQNAKISGNLECSGSSFDSEAIRFDDKFIQFPTTNEHPERYIALNLRWAHIIGSVMLKNVKAGGMITLSNAVVEGTLCCTNGNFRNPHAKALSFDGIHCHHTIFLDSDELDGFSAQGAVSLRGAQIGQRLVCEGGKFNNEQGSTHSQQPYQSRRGYAIFAPRLKVNGDLLLCQSSTKRFSAKGCVCLTNASIGGDLRCEGGEFVGWGVISKFPSKDKSLPMPHGYAILAQRLKVEGDILFCKKDENGKDENGANFTADGCVCLTSANIKGALNCDGGKFVGYPVWIPSENQDRNTPPTSVSLRLELLTTGEAIFLRNRFKSQGRVVLRGAHIGSRLLCIDAEVKSDHKHAIHASRCWTRSHVYIRECELAGCVTFEHADIGGDFIYSGNTITRPATTRPAAQHPRCKKIADFFKRIFGCRSAASSSEPLNILNMAFCSVKKGLRVEGVSLDKKGGNEPKKAKIDFGFAKAGILNIHDCFKEGGKKSQLKLEVNLDGLCYSALCDPKRRSRGISKGPESIQTMQEWLIKNDQETVQPYEQLIRVLKEHGHEHEAREVAIAKQRALNRRSRKANHRVIINQNHAITFFAGIIEFVWQYLIYVTVRYGYQPARGFTFLIILWLLSAMFFFYGYQQGAFIHREDKPYVGFEALLYSIDTLIPIVDIGQDENWVIKSDCHSTKEPNTEPAGCCFFRILYFYRCLHTVVGVFLMFLIAVSPTRLLRKD